MAVIDVWYDPARGIGSTALDSYLAEFVGERSRMNMFMMEQRLKEADPTFLNEQITQLNDQLIRLQEARASMVRVDKEGKLDVVNSIFTGEERQKEAWIQAKSAEMQANAGIQRERVGAWGELEGRRMEIDADKQAKMALTPEESRALDLNLGNVVAGQGDVDNLIASLQTTEGIGIHNDAIAYHVYHKAKAEALAYKAQGNTVEAMKWARVAADVQRDHFGGNDPGLYMERYGTVPPLDAAQGPAEEALRKHDERVAKGLRGGVSFPMEEPTVRTFGDIAEEVGLYDNDTALIDKQILDTQRELEAAKAAKAALPKPEEVMFRGLTGNYLLDPVFTSTHADQRYINQAARLSPMEREDALSYMGTTKSPMEAVAKAGEMGGLVETTQNVGAIQNVGVTGPTGVAVGVNEAIYGKAADVNVLVMSGDYESALAAYEDLSRTIENLPPGLQDLYLLEVEGTGNAIGLLMQNYEEAIQRRNAGDPKWGEELKEGANGVAALSMHSMGDNDPAPAMWLSDEIARLEALRRKGDGVGYLNGVYALYDQVEAMDPALLGDSGDAFLRIVEKGQETGDGDLMATNLYNLGKHTQNTYLDSVTAPVDKEDPRRDEREAMRVDVETAVEPPRGETADLPQPGAGWEPEDLYLEGRTGEIRPSDVPEPTEKQPPLGDPGELDLGAAPSTWVMPDGSTVTVDLGDEVAVKKALKMGGKPMDLPTPEPMTNVGMDDPSRDLTDEEAILSEWAKESGVR